MPLPNIFFADYDLNRPNYRTHTGASIQVMDSLSDLHDIGFDGLGKLNKAAADALGTDLKVQIIYDKSGNGRNVSVTGGDWFLRWDVRGVPYLEAQHVDARFKTASTYSWAAPKVFSVASTNDDQTNSYLWDLGGNFFAYNATTEAVYDLPTYPPNLGFAYNGTQLFSPVFTPDSFPLYTNETAPGLHHRYVKFQAGNDDLYADGELLITAGNAGDTARVGAICIGNFDTGGFGGLQRYYDLKIVEGTISDADAEAITAYQLENSQVLKEDICVVLGDSLAYGYDGGSIYSAPLLGNLSGLLQGMLGDDWDVWNLGRTGDTTGEVISSGIIDYAIEKYRPLKQNKVVLNGCFNDFNDDVPVATTKANLITTISTLQTAGFEVYLRTPPRSAFTSEDWKGYDAYRLGLINWMLGGFSGADGIVDETGDPNIGTAGDPTNATYFFSDKIHGKSPYYEIVADLALPFLDTEPAAPPSPIPVTPSLILHLQSNVTFLCPIWTMLAKDGTRASYCAHTRNLTFNSLDYSAAPVEASRANLTLGLMEANTTDLYGVFDDTVTEEDVVGGKWNNAEIITELVNYLDLTQGSVRRMKGNVGKFNIKNGSYIVEFQSLSARLRQEIGELTSPVDRNTLAELVDDLAPYTFARNVTAAPDRRNFTVDGTTFANGYLRYGKVTFTSGDNDDLSMEIKDNVGNAIELQLPMRSDIAISDTVSLLAGYDGSREQARDKFSAAENMSAEPDLPGIKTILKYPE